MGLIWRPCSLCNEAKLAMQSITYDLPAKHEKRDGRAPFMPPLAAAVLLYTHV